MTLLKSLAAGSLTALAFAFVTVSPSLATNSNDGVANSPVNQSDPAATPRQHRKQAGHHYHRRKDGKPQTPPAPTSGDRG